MANPFISKLEYGADLNDEDRARLAAISSSGVDVDAHQDLILEGDAPGCVHLVRTGFACRYKLLPDGGRQIMAFLLPGDICDLHVAILGQMDHSIATLCPCSIARIPRSTIDELTALHPRITRALWWATLVDEAILREWLVSMGKRPADKQLAHLLCELLVRLQAAGQAEGTSYDLPLTQAEIGDTLGLSTVHVNRVLQDLRGRGLIAFQGGRVNVLDVTALEKFAEFKPNYLHLVPR